MMFIDDNSAFNTKFITKLGTPGLNAALCNWVLDILTGRPQVATTPSLL